MSVPSGQVRELARWAICGALVLAAHGGAAAVFSTWRETVPAGEPTSAILIELSPISAAPSTEQNDLPIAPQQDQVDPEPEQKPVEKVEQQPEPKAEEPPPPPEQKVAVALPEPEKPKPPPPPKPKPRVATAPEAAKQLAPQPTRAIGLSGASNAMPSWKALISAHLQQHKSYPPGARSRREEGTTVLHFVIDRNGRVLSSGVVKSSGHSELDQETLALVRRAQPFPAAPANVAGGQFPFTVPMRYYLR